MPYSFNPLSGLGLDQSIPLDGAGKIPSDYLPSYVDDVVEYANLAGFPATGETGKIYVAIDTGFTYRWSGSVYVQINSLTGTFAADAGTAAAPSVSIGTADNGLYAPSADQLAISTNGTGRLFVDASGNIGNTASPAVSFDIVGKTILGALSTRVDENYDLQIQSGGNAEVKIQSGASNTSFLAFGTTSDALATRISVNNTDGDLRFATGNSERLRITSDGKLGLGTSSPSSLLHLADAGNITVGTTTGTKIGTASSQKIGFYNTTPVVQPTTGVTEAAFVENSGGTAVNVDSTFGGYTIQQVVQALQNLGLLA